MKCMHSDICILEREAKISDGAAEMSLPTELTEGRRSHWGKEISLSLLIQEKNQVSFKKYQPQVREEVMDETPNGVNFLNSMKSSLGV